MVVPKRLDGNYKVKGKWSSKSEYGKLWYQKNREKILTRSKIRHMQKRDIINAQHRAHYLVTRTYKLAQNRNWHQTLRMSVITMLGGKCARCGFSDTRILQIDHIEGKGREARKKFGQGVNEWYYYLKHPEEAKKNLQVLCPNCNWLKRVERREHN